MKITFDDLEELDARKADLAAQGLIVTREHLNSDKSGYIEYLDADESAARNRQAMALELQATDADLVRGLEDLIDVLEAEGILQRAKLPQELQDKLARRVLLRDSLLR